jgi:co-chaperonin GroES (HSP10)
MINPTMDNVLIKIDVVEEVSKGGLFITSQEKIVKNTGVVQAIGDSKVIEVKPGDHVIFEKGMGRRFEVPVERKEVNGYVWTDKEDYILIPFFDVLAVIEED